MLNSIALSDIPNWDNLLNFFVTILVKILMTIIVMLSEYLHLLSVCIHDSVVMLKFSLPRAAYERAI